MNNGRGKSGGRREPHLIILRDQSYNYVKLLVKIRDLFNRSILLTPSRALLLIFCNLEKKEETSPGR